MISETKLRDGDRIAFGGFEVVRADRQNTRGRGGGVAIIINKKIKFKIVNLTSRIENVAMELENGVMIIAAYSPPNSHLSPQDFHNFFPPNKKSLLLGDLNARHRLWNNLRSNSQGNVIADFLENNPLLQLLYTSTPTHYPLNGNTPSYIDIGINNGLTNLSELRTDDALSSDHLPILLTWNEPNSYGSETVFSYKQFNWRQYRAYLNDRTVIPESITTPKSLEIEVNKLVKNIQNARNQFAQKVTKKPIFDHLPDEILSLIRIKNKIRKRWQTYRRDTDRQTLSNMISTIKQKIIEHKNESCRRTLERIKPGSDALWKFVRTLKPRSNSIPNLLTSDGSECISNQEKSEAFANFLATVHKIKPNNTERHEEIDKISKHFSNKQFPIPPTVYSSLVTSPGEVCKYLHKLPNNKAPGPDDIPNKLLKNLPRKTVVHLVNIINAIFLLQHFPKQWKVALITMIPKPGKDPTNPASYRPISLLNSLGKLTEKIILTKIEKIANNMSVVPKEQFGFRKGHSTTLLTARILSDVFSAFNKQMCTAALFLDMERAFDTVWHAGLIYKLGTIFNFPLHIVSLISSYLTNRTFQVRLETATSSLKELTAGVPQGTVLSPFLYTLYTSDFPKYPTTKFALYADDTTIYNSSYFVQAARARLAYHVLELQPYFAEWKLTVNPSKTELIVFTKRKVSEKILNPIMINNIPINQSPRVKYLGIILDQRLFFNKHIDHVLKRAFISKQMLYPLIKPYSSLSIQNKLLLYTTAIRPILTYGAPVWNIISNKQRKRLQVFQNSILRSVLSAPPGTRIEHLHRQTHIDMIGDYIDKISDQFYTTKIQSSELTAHLADARQNNTTEIKYGPLYKRLPIFQKPL